MQKIEECDSLQDNDNLAMSSKTQYNIVHIAPSKKSVHFEHSNPHKHSDSTPNDTTLNSFYDDESTNNTKPLLNTDTTNSTKLNSTNLSNNHMPSIDPVSSAHNKNNRRQKTTRKKKPRYLLCFRSSRTDEERMLNSQFKNENGSLLAANDNLNTSNNKLEMYDNVNAIKSMNCKLKSGSLESSLSEYDVNQISKERHVPVGFSSNIVRIFRQFRLKNPSCCGNRIKETTSENFDYFGDTKLHTEDIQNSTKQTPSNHITDYSTSKAKLHMDFHQDGLGNLLHEGAMNSDGHNAHVDSCHDVNLSSNIPETSVYTLANQKKLITIKQIGKIRIKSKKSKDQQNPAEPNINSNEHDIIKKNSLLMPTMNTGKSQRRESFLHRAEFESFDLSQKVRKSSMNSTEQHQEEHIVTPFAQILASLKNVRQNFIALSNLPNDKPKRNSITANSTNTIGIGTHPDIASGSVMFGLPANPIVKDDSKTQFSLDTLEELDWCLSQLENMQSHKYISDIASTKFKRMLNKELSNFAEHNKSDNQIAEFIYNTYLDKKGDELDIPTSTKSNSDTKGFNLSVKSSKANNSDIDSDCDSHKYANNRKEESYDNLNDSYRASISKHPQDHQHDSTLTNTTIQSDYLSGHDESQSTSKSSSGRTLSQLQSTLENKIETKATITNNVISVEDFTDNEDTSLNSSMTSSFNPVITTSDVSSDVNSTKNIHLPLNPTMNKIFSIKSQAKHNNNNNALSETASLETVKINLTPPPPVNDNSSNESIVGQSTKDFPKYGIETEPSNEMELDKIMVDIDLWGIDIFQINDISHYRPLTAVAFTIFRKRDFLNKFQINPHTLVNFLTTLEEHYQLVPYHNKIHAADVTQSIHVLLNTKALESVFTDLEVFAAVFSAVIHDVDHPGLTNQYLINKGSELAIMYNDDSVLENHHLAVAFKILQHESRDIFVKLNKKQRQVIRKMVIDMVLATDMSKHMSLLAELKTMVETKKVSNSGIIVLESYQDRIRVLQNMLHCSDLSNPTKPLRIYQAWTDRVMNEFFQQGDRELSEGMEISPMCDRHNASIEKSQVGFIDFIVHPLWESWADLVSPDAQDVLDTLEQNRNWYCVQVDNKNNAQSSSNENIAENEDET